MKDLVLRAYQERMIEFAEATPYCYLAAEPGLGKTATALSVMQSAMFDRFEVSRWLVVGPNLVVRDSWPRQMSMWRQFSGMSSRILTPDLFDLTAEMHDLGDGRKKRGGLTFGGRVEKAAVKAELRDMGEDVTMIPGHLFHWLVKAWGANWPYDGIIGDEALMFANSTSERHKALYHVCHRLQRVKRLILMSGTPNPNGLEQLHGQIRLLDGGARLGKTKTAFQEQWMVPDQIDRRSHRVWSYKPAPGAREEVQRRIGDIVMALRADDYLDLPPLTINPIYVPLPPAARKAYDTIEEDLVLQLEDAKVLAPSQGVLAAKLRQIANGAVYSEKGKFSVLSDFKLDRLAELLDETAAEILLAFQFESDWERISKRFGKAAVRVGSTASLTDFRERRTRMLCGHASAWEGVDGLQDVCSTLVWFGATFNARHWIQTLARLRRDGSTADRIMCHQLLAEDTIEERIAGVKLPERVEEQDALLEALKTRTHRS